MKIYFTILFTVVFTIISYGQKQGLMSGAQFDGLKGKVKTVRYENTLYDENSNVSRKRGEIYFVTTYDKDGNKIERMSYMDNIPTVKTIYWEKNEEIFYKEENLSTPKQTNEMPPPPPPQKTGNEKITVRDTSFDNKLKLSYDQKGNRIEQLVYGNNGQFNNRRVYEYDTDRNKLKETVFTGDGKLYNDSTKYVYDSRGIVIQQTNFIGNDSRQESMARPNHNLTYVYVKFDKNGNWLERKVLDSIKRGVESEPRLVRVEYQTITYY